MAILATLATTAAANEPIRPSPEQMQFFEKEVRPLLAEHCWSCHGPEKQKGKLRLDSLAATLAGGETGPALTPGKPAESLLVEAIRFEGLEMPPKGKLPPEKIAVLERWIELGAPWPGSEGVRPAPARSAEPEFTVEDRQWWALQPVRKPAVPVLENDLWSRGDLDRFIVQRQRQAQLLPAPAANRTALVRRVYFDLVGLPPTPEQVAAFVADTSPQAWENLVDQLLANPGYGERWARHWLDLVRYADSDGYRIDHYREHAWRYRDYVIRSLNADKPYNRFVQEQLAGDELFPGEVEALVATGYLRQGIYEYNNRDARGQWDTILNDITDTTSDVFLGVGLQCARCHDHKFDPLLQRDYYRLRAYFAPLLPRDEVAAPAAEVQQHQERQTQWEQATTDLRRAIDEIEAPLKKGLANEAIEKFPPDVKTLLRMPPAEQGPLDQQVAALAYRQVLFEYERLDQKLKGEQKEKLLALRKQLAEFDKLKPSPLPLAHVVRDVAPVAPPTMVPKRQAEVPPGILSILDSSPATIAPLESVPNSTGRRAALARWLTAPENPLAARVMVNRVWQHHFGRGLAANASDFGRLGEPPSHPELLDFLTFQFVAEGWSLKKLHRHILLSATYTQASTPPRLAEFQRIDPENRLLWRAPTRRLDAEQIRDAILAVTGELQSAAGGPGVNADVPRRSIYCRVMRNSRDPLLEAFDLPLFFNSQAARNTTTSPVQSLLLLNSGEMLRHANQLARRAWPPNERPANESPDKFREGRIQRAWQLVFGREPEPAELAASLEYLQAHCRANQSSATGSPLATATGSSSGEKPPAAAKTGDSPLPTGKLPYRDGQAILLGSQGAPPGLAIPHHERLNVGDFTIEVYFQVRSVYETGTVRTLAGKWSGVAGKSGWQFGVTGRGSRRKPQTLVLQMFGNKRGGEFGEAALFSDQHIELNKPYYAAASVKQAGSEPGRVTFYLKDISNDDEPLLVANVPSEISGGFENEQPLSLGGRGPGEGAAFDGLIDDVRLSNSALEPGGLLFTSEGLNQHTVGYWQFEVEPGLLRDTSPQGLHIRSLAPPAAVAEPERNAFVDLCHALLNSNEFLYVE